MNLFPIVYKYQYIFFATSVLVINVKVVISKSSIYCDPASSAKTSTTHMLFSETDNRETSSTCENRVYKVFYYTMYYACDSCIKPHENRKLCCLWLYANIRGGNQISQVSSFSIKLHTPCATCKMQYHDSTRWYTSILQSFGDLLTTYNGIWHTCYKIRTFWKRRTHENRII